MSVTWTIDVTKILSESEIARVLADLKRRARRSVNSRQNLVIFRLATCCGLRVSEICGLKECICSSLNRAGWSGAWISSS